ncbi:MAG TPA: TonB-dependent receptor [Pyrinomonadaceae bacterium]|nr:TonB-dependent receptor [Pyrinomonadaceae bacterium]
MFPRPTFLSRALFVLALSAVVSLPCSRLAAAAQDTVTGAFEGTVTDSRTGAAIARASVEFINQQTGVRVVKLSDSRGRFYQGLLPPGTYTIRATATGYDPGETVQRLLATRTGEVVPVPILLDPSNPSAATTPPSTSPTTTSPTTTTTTPPTVSTNPQPTPAPSVPTPGGTPQPVSATSTDVRAGINAKDARRGGAFTEVEVQSLLLGGTTLTRTFDELALYLNDVFLPPQTISGGSGPGVGAGVGTSGQFAVNGIRSRANNFTVDGSDNNDEDIGVRRQGFFALVPQSIESVKEYQVITLLAPAQFGRNAGAQVNAISRSGGSETHGALYGIFNSSHLNARNFFDAVGGDAVSALRSGSQPVVIAPSVTFNPSTLNFNTVGARAATTRDGRGGEDSFTLGQGGLVLGGPLMPGELFYFVSAEGQLLNATREASFAVPTVAQRGVFGMGASGLFRDPFTNQPEFAFPTTFGGDAVFSLYPFPNNPGGIYGENTHTRELPASAQGKILSGKFDGHFDWAGRAQSVTGRYNFTDDWRDIPSTGGALFSSLRARVRTQNFSFFFNSEISAPASRTLVFNQVRLSYGRTRLDFDEARDRKFLIPSDDFPDVPFLLNAPVLENLTLPNFDAVNNQLVANTGPVIYRPNGTVEDRLGPLGQVVVAGFSPVGVDVFNFPQRRVNNTYQIADQLTVKRGDHNFAFGTDNRRTELNSELPRNFRPLLSFNGAPRLGFGPSGLTITNNFVGPATLAAASAASGFFQTLTTGSDATANLRFYQLNFYAQDEWRVRPNLTLSLGLRYETNTPVREIHNRIEETFDDPSIDALVPGLDVFLAGRTRIYDPDLNNFSPRLGLAYAPGWFGEPGATRLRFGYGHFNDQILGAVVSQSRNVFPTFVTVNTAGGFGNLLFPFVPLSLLNPSNPNLGLVAPGTLNLLNPNSTLAQQIATINLLASAAGTMPGASGVEVTLPARDQHAPGAHHYSFSFEQRFGQDTVFSAAYVGTQGHNLVRFSTPNLGTNAVTLLRSLDNELRGEFRFQPSFFGIAVAPGTRLVPVGNDGGPAGQGTRFVAGRPVDGVGGIQFFEAAATSRYDALQLELRGRLRNRLQYRVGYTLSKATDDVSDVFDLAGASALPQNSFTLEGERGPANFDARHRFAFHAVYEFPRFDNAAARAVFGGLQLAGTGQFQTGQPFTVNSIFDVNLDGNLTDRLNTTQGIAETGDRRQPLRLTTANLASLRAPVGQDGSVGRNTFRAGSFLDLNFAVIKNFRLGESQAIVFRTEVFNLINRANFGVPVRFLEAPGFGQATSTLTPGRRVQFHLKYSF